MPMCNYPNPCDTCPSCTDPHGCEKWIKRYLYRQKQINAYPLRAYKVEGTKEKFRYEHPDIIRRYLKHSPCDGCKRELTCQAPCGAYWRWWDARMEWMKGWWGK